MTSAQRTILRRTRRLTWTCYIAIAVLNIALFTRRHRRLTLTVLTTVTIAGVAMDLYTASQFGWI